MEKTNIVPRWKKRLQVFNLIYDDLLINHKSNKDAVIKNAFENMNFDHFQMQIIEYYYDNYDAIKAKIVEHLQPTWPFERISPITLAIIFCSYSEYYSVNTDKPILIDQSLKTCKTRGVIRDKNFINAILDKLLVSDEKKEIKE